MRDLAISVKTSTVLHVLGIDAGFRAIAEAGFDAVDFSFTRFLRYKDIVSGSITGNLFEQSEEALLSFFKPYKDAAERHGIAFAQAHAPNPSLTAHAETNERLRLAYARCLDVCAYLGCPYLVVHPFFREDASRKPAEAEWQDNLAGYMSLVPTIRCTGVTVCLENLYLLQNGRALPGPCGDIREAVRYVDALNSMAGEQGFSFCLDSGHLLLLGEEPCEALSLLGRRVKALHLHDNDGISDLHALPRTGKFDWDQLLTALSDSDYAGALNFEVYAPFDGCPPEMFPQVLRGICETGQDFRRQILARRGREGLQTP